MERKMIKEKNKKKETKINVGTFWSLGGCNGLPSILYKVHMGVKREDFEKCLEKFQKSGYIGGYQRNDFNREGCGNWINASFDVYDSRATLKKKDTGLPVNLALESLVETFMFSYNIDREEMFLIMFECSNVKVYDPGCVGFLNEVVGAFQDISKNFFNGWADSDSNGEDEEREINIIFNSLPEDDGEE